MYETRKTSTIRRSAGWLLAVVFALSLCWQQALASPAEEKTVIPLGKAVGIKLFADGVLVVGLTENSDCPARQCGLREGDIITAVSGRHISSTEQVQALLQTNGGEPLALTVHRGQRTLSMTACPVQNSSGTWQLGAWIRDSMAGIGTLTYYDPQTASYGALGHGITDMDTAQLMSLSSGSIMETTVKAVKKGLKGEPGELRGDFTVQRDVGTLTANTNGGIFGKVADAGFIDETQAIPVAAAWEVKCGPATILATVNGSDTREYQVEILRLYGSDHDTRNLMLKVTDPQLLAATGGIVQGMSGSPILQNGKFVGAVTHVLIDDPARGYGIFMENMLKMAG